MKKTVMTVDDSSSMRQMLVFALSSSGFEVVEAANGQEALASMEQNGIDLLITDLNMPVMNGLDLIKAVRSRPQWQFLPSLMLTTESQDSMKQAGKAAGATGWIVKPFEQAKLLSVVQRVLG